MGLEIIAIDRIAGIHGLETHFKNLKKRGCQLLRYFISNVQISRPFGDKMDGKPPLEKLRDLRFKFT